MKFLHEPPRFLFFTGKGGVGKTSIACATAVHLTRDGKRVLLVSTDPASNVGQVFGLAIGNTITPVPAAPGLSALEIDPEQAAHAYRERILQPVRGLLPEPEIVSITEQLSGSCTTEIASFNEFTDLLTDPDLLTGYDHVVFDTAPTGHTIRLLQLTGSWTGFLTAGKGDASCLGPLAGLDKQRGIYAAAVDALTDPAQTRLVLVTRAQTGAISEVARTSHELAHIGITTQNLVVNGVLPGDDDDELSRAVRHREAAALAATPAGLAAMPRDLIDLKPFNILGPDALNRLFDPAAPVPGGDLEAALDPTPGNDLAALVDDLEQPGRGLIMCLGKGGVGKTTVAAAIAVALAHRGHPVHLTTTDPAAHIDDTLTGEIPNLRVTRIDPAEATRAYRERVLSSKGKNLDEAGRATLAEDLLSPCTEEVAVFAEFSHVITESRRQFVVIDTAPTGHTLLLLDATGSYHREMARQIGDSMHFRTPLMQLQDPEQTRAIIVTLAEPTPVTEAEQLEQDLDRAGIHPWAWVINNSLAAARPASPLLRHRAQAEDEQIARVHKHADRVATIPLLATEPIGEAALMALVAQQPQPML